jgi:hypothetical protein
MKNLYYITRSFPPIKTGGALMREAQVNELKKYFNVIVYTLGYNGYRNTTQVINHIDLRCR